MNKPALCLSALFSMACIAPAQSAPGDAPALDSQIPDIVLSALSDLPAAPDATGDEDWCGHLTIEPSSQGGQLAASRGWSVTGELTLGSYEAVSFVGGFVQGTSGSCQRTDGNIAFFEDGQLIALAYGPDAGSLNVAQIEPFGETGARIWDGDFLSQPIADITVGESGIEIVPLASSEPVCGGDAEIPNIYGMEIAEARTILKDSGWAPATESIAKNEMDLRSEDLIALGIGEVTGCSGTGFGYCGFAYEGEAGTLSVTTVGDAEPPQTPTVSSYGVQCSTL